MSDAPSTFRERPFIHDYTKNFIDVSHEYSKCQYKHTCTLRSGNVYANEEIARAYLRVRKTDRHI